MTAILMSIYMLRGAFLRVSMFVNVIATYKRRHHLPLQSRSVRSAGIVLVVLFSHEISRTQAAEDHRIEFGPVAHQFQLTLDPGTRLEAAGPLFYDEHKETQHTWAVPPLFSYTHDPATEATEYDFIYPLLTFDRFGRQYRWQFFQLLTLAG